MVLVTLDVNSEAQALKPTFFLVDNHLITDFKFAGGEDGRAR